MLPNSINVNSQMEQLANNAITIARDKFGVILDFTENSLQQLDLILQQAYEQIKQASTSENFPSLSSLETTARVWGSYFGEVIRRSLGGDWIEDSINVFIQLGTRRVDPLGQVRSRIVVGIQFNVQSFFQGLKLGIEDNLIDERNTFISDKYKSQVFGIDKGIKKHSSFLFAGIIGMLLVVSLCSMGLWILFRQGVISSPMIILHPASRTSLPTKTFVLAQATHALRPTNTPRPTSSPHPTATPIYGTFFSPFTLGDSITLPIVPLELRKNPEDSAGEMEFTLLETKVGDSAKLQAKQTLDWYKYQDPIVGQEYLAVKGHLKYSRKNDNTVETILLYDNLTLRYLDGGDDIWSIDPVVQGAEGYPPIEGDFWIFFLIKQGSQPLLYFQPWLLLTEQHGIRTSGVYFDLSQH